MKVTTVTVILGLSFGWSALAGEIAGIGLDIIQRSSPNEPLKTRSNAGSPAEKAGVTAQGLLISVDGTNVVSMAMTQAVKMVRGAVGTWVTVQIANTNMTHTNTFKIKRSRMVIVDNKIQFFDQ